MLSRITPTFSRQVAGRFSTFNNQSCTLSKYRKEYFESQNIWGLLTSIDAKNCDPAKIRDAKYIEKYAIELCKYIDMKRFGPCQVVHFGENDKVAGYSMVQLIQTSCISGHFANATNASYIDIFSCKYYDPEKAAKFTADFFGSKDYAINIVLRK